jgi:hypothetical protein
MQDAVILTSSVAARLLAALAAGEAAAVSLDLGLSTSRVAIEDGVAVLGGVRLCPAVLRRIAKDENRCYELVGGEPRPIAVVSKATGWVRTLVPTADAPTTLVAGFPMHRLTGTTPIADARAKIRALGRPRGRALDTATGLGYTAIELAKTCSEVVSVELDPAAMELARRNPWSRPLFEASNIRLLEGDAAQAVAGFEDAGFSVVLHDPPTLQLGGDLYGSAFYAELRRVLKPGGRLFHYVGDPASGAGARVTRGVMRRLADTGFTEVRRDAEAFGVTAVAGLRGRQGGRLRRTRGRSRSRR